ncbi:MAG: nicotinate-nucleotide adenylyltransferase [Gammaproteobacteria bacterium]|jgi:nicotinate-nucleotide adenylyltransferase
MTLMSAAEDAPLGIFGGTFDPVHVGHLRTGYELMRALRLAELRWIPVGNPGHRDPPLASAELRLEMLRVAIAGQPGFVLDDREISRGGVSYTIDTLSELRGEYPQRSLCLLLGMDAFASFTSWHRWQEIFAVAHVVVAHRPGWQAPTTGPLAALLAERGVADVAALHARRAGCVHVRKVTPLEISSTDLRELLVSGGDPRFLVPEPVRSIILESGCYALAHERTQTRP